MTVPGISSNDGQGGIATGGVLRNFRLGDAAGVLKGERHGADVEFTSVSIDTRTLNRGALFIALHGPHFDGHDFISQARDNGAAAAIVSRCVDTSLPFLVVRDTRSALAQLAAAWRRGFDIPVIAVTGSAGKTTVKEMLASILVQVAPVLVTRGNLNNELGVPLTLLNLRHEHHAAVIEMGANHAGEITTLASIAGPAISLITNAGHAHLEGFGGIDGVARAKGEIIEGLSADGTAIINVDDPHAEYWRNVAGTRRIVTFGIENTADVHAPATSIVALEAHRKGMGTAVTPGMQFTLHLPSGQTEISLGLPGRHNVLNALAAAAAAHALGVEPGVISRGLADTRTLRGRLAITRGAHGRIVIDDTYNANPASLTAALEVLAGLQGVSSVLIIGDMAELGSQGEELHAQAGREAREAGVDYLYATGPYSRAAVQAFGNSARHFESQEELIEVVCKDLPEKVAVLVKGSRCMQMERVVQALQGKAGDQEPG